MRCPGSCTLHTAVACDACDARRMCAHFDLLIYVLCCVGWRPAVFRFAAPRGHAFKMCARVPSARVRGSVSVSVPPCRVQSAWREYVDIRTPGEYTRRGYGGWEQGWRRCGREVERGWGLRAVI